jgi:hypothetical protein
MLKHVLGRVILSGILAACLLSIPLMVACVTCPPPTDKPTCDVQNAIAIGGLVDQGAQALLVAIPILPPSIVAGIAAYHLAYPLAVKAAQAALQEYETAHTGLWAQAVAGIEALYNALDALITSFGQPSLVTAAKVQVKAQGAEQVIMQLKMKGVIR